MAGPDLSRLPVLRSLLRSPWPRFLAVAVTLGGFLAATVAALLGTPVGSRNFGIVFVWIAWWALLMLIAVPFFGRSWCSICPIPVPGEWLQRGRLLLPGSTMPISARRWPARWRSLWLQNLGFAALAVTAMAILTTPRLTGFVLLGLLIAALAVSVIFERRAFCRYLCPVGGFIGLYSQVAPLELRARDPALCASHHPKTCYKGTTKGFGCLWQTYPAALVKNNACGLCLECLRTCPFDNVALRLRPFGADLLQPSRRLDEAFKACLLLGSALAYSAVMLGPWASLKRAAYAVGSAPWLLYALAFLVLVLGVVPGLFTLATALGTRLSGARLPPRRALATFSSALVPLGLASWLAFSLSFILANLSYLGPVLSDPLGRGWDLFGTASLGWTPFLTEWLPVLQAFVLVAGLYWTCALALSLAVREGNPLHRPQPLRAARLQAAPVALFSLAVTLLEMRLLLA